MHRYPYHQLLLILLLIFLSTSLEARYYDARTGRFLSIDPKAAMNPSQSPYNYSFNNPLVYIDTDGRWPTYIHNKILETAFKGILTTKQIDVLKQASVKVDEDQSIEGSYKHEMRSPGETVEDAESKMNEFISNEQNIFITGEGDAALEALGEAMHPLMDATSPSHEGFQEWGGLNSATNLINGGVHVMKESIISDKTLQATAQKILQFYRESQKKREEQKKQEEQKRKEEQKKKKEEQKKRQDDQDN